MHARAYVYIPALKYIFMYIHVWCTFTFTDVLMHLSGPTYMGIYVSSFTYVNIMSTILELRCYPYVVLPCFYDTYICIYIVFFLCAASLYDDIVYIDYIYIYIHI